MKNKNAEHPDKAAQALKKSGIEVVVVGAGSTDRNARDVLAKVAGSNSRAFPLVSFNDLVNDVYLVATSACQGMYSEIWLVHHHFLGHVAVPISLGVEALIGEGNEQLIKSKILIKHFWFCG